MPATSTLFTSIQDLGYAVDVEETAGGGFRYTARKGKERHVVTARADEEDVYRAWVELAVMCGIRVEE